MRFRHEVFLLFLFMILSVSILASGCSPKISCEEPNVLIGSSCCLDVNHDGRCDSATQMKEPDKHIPEVIDKPTHRINEPLPEELFAKKFESDWNKRNFNALYTKFSDDLQRKWSREEFNFMLKRLQVLKGIESVSFKGMIGNKAEFIVTLKDDKERTAGEVVKEGDEFKIRPFYIFDDLDINNICSDDECFSSFAKMSGNKQLCESAGELKDSCLEHFSDKNTLSKEIDYCTAIKDFYSKVDCLDNLAVKEKNIEPCWHNEYDEQIYGCMGLVAAIDDDPKLCKEYASSRGFPATRLQNAYCIMGFVSKTLNNSACSLIDRRDDVVLGAMAENCDNLRFS